MLLAVKNAKGEWCVSIGWLLSDREVRLISWPSLTTRKTLSVWVNKEKVLWLKDKNIDWLLWGFWNLIEKKKLFRCSKGSIWDHWQMDWRLRHPLGYQVNLPRDDEFEIFRTQIFLTKMAAKLAPNPCAGSQTTRPAPSYWLVSSQVVPFRIWTCDLSHRSLEPYQLRQLDRCISVRKC